jgi:hypothetical protein
MDIDQAIGQMAAELMEEVAEDYGGEAQLRVAALIVAVDHGDEAAIHWRFAPEDLRPTRHSERSITSRAESAARTTRSRASGGEVHPEPGARA